jgi:hypothetical protein
MKIRTFTKARGGKARKRLAIFSGLILKIVIKVRKLIFKLCLPKYITIDLNQLPPPKKVYLYFSMLLKHCLKKQEQAGSLPPR